MAGFVAAAVEAQAKEHTRIIRASSNFVPVIRWEVRGISWRARERKIKRKVVVVEATAHVWVGLAGSVGGV